MIINQFNIFLIIKNKKKKKKTKKKRQLSFLKKKMNIDEIIAQLQQSNVEKNINSKKINEELKNKSQNTNNTLNEIKVNSIDSLEKLKNDLKECPTWVTYFIKMK